MPQQRRRRHAEREHDNPEGVYCDERRTVHDDLPTCERPPAPLPCRCLDHALVAAVRRPPRGKLRRLGLVSFRSHVLRLAWSSTARLVTLAADLRAALIRRNAKVGEAAGTHQGAGQLRPPLLKSDFCDSPAAFWNGSPRPIHDHANNVSPAIRLFSCSWSRPGCVGSHRHCGA
jgi:hypothetical protein